MRNAHLQIGMVFTSVHLEMCPHQTTGVAGAAQMKRAKRAEARAQINARDSRTEVFTRAQ